MIHYAGQAIPGSEERSRTLDHAMLESALDVSIAPGTFNVSLMADIELGNPTVLVGDYTLWPCTVSTSGMIERNETGVPGWVIRDARECVPGNFVEVISAFHVRSALKMDKWPAFPVEISLNCAKEDLKPCPKAQKPSSTPSLES